MTDTEHNVGFTGTRRGMTLGQKAALQEHLDLNDDIHFLHHGDCIGADAQAHSIALGFGIQMKIHPPKDQKYRAFCSPGIMAAVRPYLERNHRIVEESDYLIAAPADDHEVLRSGTWTTYRYARRQGKKVLILWPGGNEEWRD